MCTKICAKESKKYKFKNLCCLSTNFIKTITRKPRCLKLKYRNLDHTKRLNSLNGYADYILAPPCSN